MVFVNNGVRWVFVGLVTLCRYGGAWARCVPLTVDPMGIAWCSTSNGFRIVCPD